MLRLLFLPTPMAVCQVPDLSGVDLTRPLTFFANTGEELSLACPADAVPGNALRADNGWSLFWAEGQLEFSLVGILAGIATTLAAEGISIVALSTFDTDYVLVRSDRADDARRVLAGAGYEVV